MALFSNKELEALQIENKRLRTELERMQCREESYKSTISALNQGVEKFREQLLSFQRETENQAAEITELRRQLANAKKKPHNERGAGRSRKATAEQINFILFLRAEGKSYDYIAHALTEKYGGKWNKTNVRNTVIAEKN